MNARATNILRWAAVLPAAIGAYLGIILMALLIDTSDPDQLDSAPDVFLIEISVATIAPIASIYSAATTAPRYKFAVAAFLAVLNGLMVSAICACLFYGVVPYQSKWPVPFWKHLIAAISSIVLTIFACWEVSLGGTGIRMIRRSRFW